MRNFLIALAVFVIVVIGFGTVIARIARKPAPPPTTGQAAGKFSDRTTKVSFITEGAIVGPENHRSIRIIVDQTERKLEILKGYDGEVIRSQSFANDSTAFTEFLIALDGFGYTKENPRASKDERGVCPLGTRYVYEASYERGEPLRSWSASCGGVGRLQGNIAGIQQLFRNQIPDHSKLIVDVNLAKP